MAHLASSYASFQTFLQGADTYWSVELAALNNSGITGTAVLAINTEDDGTRYLDVSIAAEGLTPGVQHAQHIHGTFDADGKPSDARMPGVADDTDSDGFVEVLEGLGAYGDILLALVSGGALPWTDANGQLTFIQSYDLGDDGNFFSPVSMTDYTGADLLPLGLREIVIHGQNVGAGPGAGTGGEIDGTQNGFVPILPVAAGEIEATGKARALDILEDQFAIASDTFRLGRGADELDAGPGDDTVYGGKGTDRLNGGADDDRIFGGAHDDVVRGDDGNDRLRGGTGDDRLSGGSGDDGLRAGGGSDTVLGGDGNDLLIGGSDSDTMNGGAGNDRLFGGTGNDFLTGSNGRDILFGGDGWDEFIYADMREGRDVIRDFTDGTDLIDLSALGIGFADVSVSAAQAGASTQLAFGNTTVLLENVMQTAIDAGDFVF